MTSTTGPDTFTEALISAIRMQRHQGLRVFIATQEPTISRSLMDLCTLTLVHSFSSPRWMQALKNHLPGLSHHKVDEVFETIVKLGTGEALLFCVNALLKVGGDGGKGAPEKTGVGWKEVRVRKRVTFDGGASVMAS